jgi:hypothetical protein
MAAKKSTEKIFSNTFNFYQDSAKSAAIKTRILLSFQALFERLNFKESDPVKNLKSAPPLTGWDQRV